MGENLSLAASLRDQLDDVQHALTRKMRPVELRATALVAGAQAEQALLGAHQQGGTRGRPAGSVRHFSLNRGISSTRLQGRVRRSSCASINASQAVAQAPDDPGTQKT